MRILIYIEPFPVRQSLHHGSELAIAFANMLVSGSTGSSLSDFDVRIYSNRDTLNDAQAANVAAKRFYLWPEGTEQDRFRADLTDWTNQGVRAWRDLIAGEGPVCRAYQEIVEGIHKRFAFDLVLTVGNNGAVKRFATSAGIHHIILDTSFLEPSIFEASVLDVGGTDGSAILAQTQIAHLKAAVGNDSWPVHADLDCVSRLSAADCAQESLGPVSFRGQDRILRRGGARAAMISLQPYDDGGFLAHGQFASAADMLDACLPVLADNGIISIVRPPASTTLQPGQAAASNQAHKVAQKFADKVVWIDETVGDLPDTRLLTLSDMTVTANGAAGLEALFFGKPVCVLGSAAFKPAGVFPDLEALATRHFDARAYSRNIAAIRTYFLRAQFIAKNEAFNFDSFIDRVIASTELWQDCGNQAGEMVKASFAAFSARRTEMLKDLLSQRASAPANIPGSHEFSTSTGRSRTSSSNIFMRAIAGTGLAGPDAVRLKSLGARFSSSETAQSGAFSSVPTYPLSQTEEHALDIARKRLAKTKKKGRELAVIAHCFYLDSTAMLIDRLSRMSQQFDLFVTVPPFGAPELTKVIRASFSKATIIHLPNRGRDVWPFFFLLAELGTDRYNHVLKLHTKKSGSTEEHLNDGHAQKMLDYYLACLVGNRDGPEPFSKTGEQGEEWAMAGPNGLLQTTRQHPLNLKFDVRLTFSHMETAPPAHWQYFAGSMFWAKPAIFDSILQVFSIPDHYEPGTNPVSNQMENLAEQAFGLCAHQSGLPIASCQPDNPSPTLRPSASNKTLEQVIETLLTSGSKLETE